MQDEKILAELKEKLGAENEALIKIAYPYMLRKYTGMSLSEIATLCSTTNAVVLHRVKDCEKMLAESPESKFRRLMDEFAKERFHANIPLGAGYNRSLWRNLFSGDWPRNSSLIKWSVTFFVVASSVMGLKILENANRLERVKATAEGILRERWFVYGITFLVTFWIAAMVADMALKRVLKVKERLLLLFAMVLFTGSFWVGGVYLSNRAFSRSVDATMEYHKLMRKWEPIWAEQAKIKAEAEKHKREDNGAN